MRPPCGGLQTWALPIELRSRIRPSIIASHRPICWVASGGEWSVRCWEPAGRRLPVAGPSPKLKSQIRSPKGWMGRGFAARRRSGSGKRMLFGSDLL